MKIILAGGTGFIGQALVAGLLGEKHHVVLLTRHPEKTSHLRHDLLKVVPWDGRTAGDWCRELEKSDAVINLCGESVAAKRWTPNQKAKLISSRIEPTQILVQAIKKASQGPNVLINASAAGFYGHVEHEAVWEAHERGKGFLADICQKWESAAREAEG